MIKRAFKILRYSVYLTASPIKTLGKRLTDTLVLNPKSPLIRVFLVLVILSGSFTFAPVSNVSAATDGTQVMNRMTRPGGGIWLEGSTPGSGHWWQPDNVLGVCRLDGFNTTTGGANITSNCQGSAKTSHQIAAEAYDPNNPGKTRFVYVADEGSKSVSVFRFTFNPANETLTSPLDIQVPNQTSVGGGAGGGRSASVALSPDGKDLFVGYIKSGDIMKVSNVNTIPASQGSPFSPPVVAVGPCVIATACVAKVGDSSDGRGTSGGFAMFTYVTNPADARNTTHSDLYLGEIGGLGLSVIKDINGFSGTGTKTAPCGSPAGCTAKTVVNKAGAVVSNFPGGLAADQQYIYIGDAPRNIDGSVLKFDPAAGSVLTISTRVSPAYQWTDNVSTFTGQAGYRGISGIGIAKNGDLYIGDDPTFGLAVVVNTQGHVWRVTGVADVPVIDYITPASGTVAGGTQVSIVGQNLVVPGNTGIAISFGGVAATSTVPGGAFSCTHGAVDTCLAVSPIFGGSPAVGGPADITLTNAAGKTSAITPADVFTYVPTVQAPPPGNPAVSSVSPNKGALGGNTLVTITGNYLLSDGANNPLTVTGINFGPLTADATKINCSRTNNNSVPPVDTCTAISPASSAAIVADIVVTRSDGISTPVNQPADQYTYANPIANLIAHGVTAPKGGVTWMPDASGGHFWATDHAQGVCRFDPVPGSTLIAINTAICDPGSNISTIIGSPGQGAYDPLTNFFFVPDNAVRSQGVWRFTFDPNGASGCGVVGSICNVVNLAGPTDLKPNGLVVTHHVDGLGVSHTDLIVGDLVDGNIRRMNNVDGDPRTVTMDIVAVTQAQKVGVAGTSRGINGTMAAFGTKVFLPENNAATYFDLNWPCAAVGTVTPCNTVTLNFLTTTAPIFVSGVAVDQGCDVSGNTTGLPVCPGGSAPRNPMVYISNSSGGAAANIFRFDPATLSGVVGGIGGGGRDGSPGIVYLTQGVLPAAGTPEATVWCSTTCTRPWDPALTPGGTVGMSFAQGMFVDPNGSLYVTEDATAGARSGRGHVWKANYIP